MLLNKRAWVETRKNVAQRLRKDEKRTMIPVRTFGACGILVPTHLLPLLSAEASAHVQQALHSGAPGQTLPLRGEPDLVAAVVLGAMPEIARGWRQHLNPHGIKLSVISVFCHQSPMVRFRGATRNARCELADLLIVFDDLTGGTPNRTAVLIQAKMITQGQAPRVNGDQDYLYSAWPVFQFESQSYKNCVRDFEPSFCGCLGEYSGRYGLIDKMVPFRNWYQRSPHALMATNSPPDLGCFLAQMLDAAGRGYGRCCNLTNPTDKWSITIEELLQQTARKKFNLRSSFRNAKDRKVTSIESFDAVGPLAHSPLDFKLHPELTLVGGEPPLPPKEKTTAISEEEDGINTIRIVLAPMDDSSE